MNYFARKVCMERKLVFVAESNEAMGRVIRRNPNSDLVSDNDADLKALHLSAQSGGDIYAIFQLDSVIPTASNVGDFALELYQVIFSHDSP